jgi:hypothetical protein
MCGPLGDVRGDELSIFSSPDHDTIHIYSKSALLSYNVRPQAERFISRRMAEKKWPNSLPKTAFFQCGICVKRLVF